MTVSLLSPSAGNFHSVAITHSVVDTTLGLCEVDDSKVSDADDLLGQRVTSNDNLLKIFKGKKAVE